MEYFRIPVLHRQEVMLEWIESSLKKAEMVLQKLSCGFDGLREAKEEQYDLILRTYLPLITGYKKFHLTQLTFCSMFP